MSNAACFVVSYALNAAWEIPLLAAAGWSAARLLRFRAMIQLAISFKPNTVAGASLASLHADGARRLTHAGVLFLPNWLIGSLVVLYACSLVYFAARLLAAAGSLVRGASPAAWTAGTNALWRRARQTFALADAAVLASDRVRGVMTIGARRPSILLPAGFLSHSNEQELLSALGHELAHVQRRDYAKNLLYEIAGIAGHSILQPGL
jgi:bla regulator protein blaR1